MKWKYDTLGDSIVFLQAAHIPGNHTSYLKAISFSILLQVDIRTFPLPNPKDKGRIWRYYNCPASIESKEQSITLWQTRLLPA